MKQFLTKGVLLLAPAMAWCAFAMPSASASSWGSIGSEHTLDSPNLGFIIDAVGATAECSRSQFTVDVMSAAVMEITTGSLSDCTVAGPVVGTCTATSLVTNLPWTATAVSTSNIQIHGVLIRMFLENHPGSAACAAAGIALRVTGTLSGARWNGNSASQHEILLPSAGGLFSHSPIGNNQPLTTTGTIRDTQQTLTVTN